MTTKFIKIPCMELEQPIGKFYSGVINYKDLIRISFADTKNILVHELDRYLGIQRRISPNRVAELEKYINLPDSSFSTNIVLSISSENALYNPKQKSLKIRDGREVARIIDGQHRIAGLEKCEHENFQLMITIFIDMDIENQALTYTTINLAQTQVNKALAHDLYEYAKLASPHKTAHTIARFLNSRENSPFEGRIKILGSAQESIKRKQTLTQKIVVEVLLELISGSIDLANLDRDMIKSGERLKLDQNISGSASYFIRSLFIQRRDVDIARIIWNYFSAIKDRWPIAWKNFNPKNVLIRKTGFRAFIGILPKLLAEMDTDTIPFKENFSYALQGIPLVDKDFLKPIYQEENDGESSLMNAIGANWQSDSSATG